MRPAVRDVASGLFVKAMICKGYVDLYTMHRNTVHARRKNEKLLLNLTGDKTTEDQVAEVVKAVSRKVGIPLDKWAVTESMEALPYHYTLLIENADGVDLRPYGEVADQALKELNLRYRDMQQAGMVGKMTIQNLAPGTQDAYLALLVKNGAPELQVKPVRILNNEQCRSFYQERIAKD